MAVEKLSCLRSLPTSDLLRVSSVVADRIILFVCYTVCLSLSVTALFSLMQSSWSSGRISLLWSYSYWIISHDFSVLLQFTALNSNHIFQNIWNPLYLDAIFRFYNTHSIYLLIKYKHLINRIDGPPFLQINLVKNAIDNHTTV